MAKIEVTGCGGARGDDFVPCRECQAWIGWNANRKHFNGEYCKDVRERFNLVIQIMEVER